MATLFSLPLTVPVDSSGQPYAGAKLYFYAEGTTTQQSPYTDAALTTPHAQPVVADANGRFPAIYLDPGEAGDYRVQLKTSAGVLIYDQDEIPKSAVPLVLQSAATAGASGEVVLGNATQSTVGAAGGASALPATPSGYLKIYIGSTQYVLPYYAQA